MLRGKLFYKLEKNCPSCNERIGYELKFRRFTTLPAYRVKNYHFFSASQAPVTPKSLTCIRPVSHAILHISRIELAKLSSCEVRRLNQFRTAD